MSAIHKVDVDVDLWDAVVVRPIPETPIDHLFDGRQLSGTWTPPTFRRLSELDPPPRPLGDVSQWGGTYLVISNAAQSLLVDVIERGGELLPVLGLPDGYRLLNVLELRAALDEAASDIFRFASGRIVDISHLVLRREAAGDAPMFKLAEFPTGPIFVNDEVAKRIRASGLTGFRFTRVWPDR